ncbi:hypothetical protein C0992_011676 [Termitomyces sp. T32_za158]|nr:hypothetical protein C0992_011676 [Termitomyces sp. T32_za158]
MDAVRTDGSLVVLKEIELDSNPEEIFIGKLFSSGKLNNHPKNHCVRFLDVIEPYEGSGSAFVVMPYLLKTTNPPFQTIGEVVAYFRQIFEGWDGFVAKRKQGFDFMEELVNDMTNSDPQHQ